MDELSICQPLAWEFRFENTAILFICGFRDDEIVLCGGGSAAASRDVLPPPPPPVMSSVSALTSHTVPLPHSSAQASPPFMGSARYSHRCSFILGFLPCRCRRRQLTLAPLAGFRMTNRRDANNLFGDNRTAADNLAR
ncbi:hypothetical protein Y032_0539g3152 [Ancylostoma ceylanicum]|uniref:Uncharacterized protein n=1 Tax=Ancylostoma ceylanicum TaxID=53326 RepID=A0A016WSF3_9BILA|nr:hypothetical protein Y032_0539g3152 [Ancylostoma ceylanicum]